MTRKMVAALVGVLVVLAVAPEVRAAPFTPRMWLAYTMAEEYWAGPPPCATLDAQIVAPDSLNRYGNNAGGVAANRSGACLIWIERYSAAPVNFAALCQTMLHEVGHLRGLGHSTDPTDIMYPAGLTVPPRCRWAGRVSGALAEGELPPKRHRRLAAKFWAPLRR